MEVIITLAIGLVIGVVTKLLVPGRNPGNLFPFALVGVAGAFVGSYTGQGMGMFQIGSGLHYTVAAVGALVGVITIIDVIRPKAL